MRGGPWIPRRWWLAAWATASVVLAVVLVATTDEPHLAHGSALDAVFDTRWMVAGSRLLLGIFFVYAVASVGVRVARGEWVRSVGPVDTDTAALASSQDDLRERLREGDETIADLRQRLATSDRRYLELVARITPQDVQEEGGPTP